MAETLTSQAAVSALITAAKQNDPKEVLDTADLVKIATHPWHSREPRDLIACLKAIELVNLEFQQIKIGPLPERTTVRIVAPISCDCDVVLCEAIRERQEDHYMTITVHS